MLLLTIKQSKKQAQINRKSNGKLQLNLVLNMKKKNYVTINSLQAITDKMQIKHVLLLQHF